MGKETAVEKGKGMLRNVLGVVVGLLVGSMANMLLISLNGMLFTIPEGVEPGDQEAFRAYVAGLPVTGFLLVFLAHFSQVFVGGLVAAKIGRAAPRTLVGIIGAFTVAGSLMTNLSIQPPAWTWIEIPLYLPVIWGTVRLAEKMRGEAPARPAEE